MNVLVVDDDAVSRLLLATAVEALGHACAVADDGESGWARYREAAPDVVVTDRVMAGMDGLELCRRIRGDAAAGYTYVVLATGLGTREDVLAGMEAGADDYLVKPVDPFELRVRLLAAERVTALHRRLEESQHALEALNTELARVASTDGLTGIGNRRRFDEDLAGLHARARRAGGSYAVAMLDIDRFKAYNDELGHQAGDAALRAVAGRVAEACREGDEVYRYGGEELVVLFHGETLPTASVAGERLRAAVADLAIDHPSSGRLTVSVGIGDLASLPSTAEADEVVRAADAALYRAKAGGRDRVEPAPR